MHAFLAEYFVDSCPFNTGHHRFLSFRAATIIILGDLLLYRNSQNRFARNLRSIDIVKNKLEFFEKPLFLLFLRKFIQGKSHLFILFIIIKIVIFRISYEATLYQFFYKLHCRIIFLTVFLLFRFHDHLFQDIIRWNQIDNQIILGSFLHKNRLLSITQRRKSNIEKIITYRNGKLTVIVRHKSLIAPHKKNRSIRYRLMGYGISYYPLYHCRLLCRSRNRKPYK